MSGALETGMPYTDTMTVRDARAAYFADNDFGEDGGYSKDWVPLKVGPIPFAIPNTEGRKVAAALRGALERLEPALIGNTMVLVTTCDARDLPELFHESSAAAPKAARPLKGTKDAAHLQILAENERAMAS